MLKNPADNYYKVQQDIAKRVLATPLASSIGYGGIGSHGYNEILAIANGEKSDRYGYASVEFRRADTSCDLYIRTDSRNDFLSTRQVDAEGNEWVEYGLKVEVSYPSHGSESPATVLARVNLYQQVAMLAAEIAAEFGGRNQIRKMVATKAEVDARAEALAKEKAQALARKIVSDNNRAMRVGSERALTRGDVSNPVTYELPEGYYTVEIGNGSGIIKTFALNVFSHKVLLTRLT